MCFFNVCVLVTILPFISVVTAVQNEDTAPNVSEKQVIDCVEEADLHCIKLKTVTSLYSLLNTKSLELADGLKLEYSGEKIPQQEAIRSLLKGNWGDLVFNLLPVILKDLSLKLSVFDGENFVVSRSQKENGFVEISFEQDNQIIEARGKKKEAMALSMMMASGLYTTLITVGLIAVKFLAFKSVLVGTISLIVAALEGLSRLVNPNAYNQRYGSWNRSGGAIKKSIIVPEKPIIAVPSVAH